MMMMVADSGTGCGSNNGSVASRGNNSHYEEMPPPPTTTPKVEENEGRGLMSRKRDVTPALSADAADDWKEVPHYHLPPYGHGTASSVGARHRPRDELDEWVERLLNDPNESPPPTDLCQAVSRLMNEAGETARKHLRHAETTFSPADFFERLIETVEPLAPGESLLDFELRRREMATEHQAAFNKNPSVGSVADKFASGDRLFRDQHYGRAALEFTEAVFAAESRRRMAESCAHYSEVDEDTGAPKQVPFDLVYLDLKMKQIESLLLDKQYKKTSVYSLHLLNWMVRNSLYASYHADKYSLLQIWLAESEVALGHYHRAIDLCSLAIRQFCQLRTSVSLERPIYNVRQTFFERLIEYYEKNGGLPDEIERDRRRAKIIVDEGRQRGVADGQFVVNDLESALRIAKNGDVIFLEAGTFTPSADSAASLKKPTFELRKSVHIIGASTNKTVISGSIVKWGTGAVELKRLKLEVGIDIDADDDVYFMEGMTTIENCVIESPVNTCMYVISNSDERETALRMKHCILDGLEGCRRMVCFQGPRPVIHVESCYVSDMFSFCTVISPNEVSTAMVSVVDSVLYDVQDGLKIIVHHKSQMLVQLVGCQFDMALYLQDSPSHAFSLTGGTCQVMNNLIFSNHLDAVGLSLHSLKRATIDTNLIETGSENPRALALGEGIVLSENLHVTLSSTEVVGMRIGFHLSNQFDEHNTCLIRDSSAKSCALGVYVRAAGANQRRPQASAAGSASTNDASSPSGEDPAAMPNMDVSLYRCHFDTTHYGLMCESGARAKLRVDSSSFYDVPRPLLLARDNLIHANLRENEYRIGLQFAVPSSGESSSEASGDGDEANGVDDRERNLRERKGPSQTTESEAVRNKMILYLAANENLPHRLAIEPREFLQIGSSAEETAFHEKYHSFRNQPAVELE